MTKVNPLAPGPKGNWLLGVMPEVRRDPLAFFSSLPGKYGPVTSYRFGYLRSHLVAHPDAVKQVLVDNVRNYTKEHVSYTMLSWVIGNGLLTSRGDFWLRQRRLAQPAFHKHRIAEMTSWMVSAAEAHATRWETLAHGGETIDVADEMMALTLKVVGDALFGADVGEDAKIVGREFHVLNEQVAHRFRALRLLPPILPFGADRDFRRAKRNLDEVVQRIIVERRAGSENRSDLLSLFMNAQDEDGSRMTDVQLADEVLTMLLAGHETTAVTLSWIWALLDQHPDVEAQLHDELDRELSGRSPSMADVPRLVYTKQVIEESMRLYPPVYAFGRKVEADDVLAGYRIPKGSVVDVSPYVTHRLPEFWDEPNAFKPERFAPALAATRHRFAYFPFIAGPRQCIGNVFAMVEAQLLLATLAQRFRVRRMQTGPVVPEPLLTLRPRGGLPVRIEHRRPRASEHAA